MGRTIALFGDSGSGKTTQIGDRAKAIFAATGRKTHLYSADPGGWDSIDPLVRLGIIVPHKMLPDDSPWIWITAACEGAGLNVADVGLIAFDSAPSMGEALLMSCAEMAKEGEDVGGRPAPKLVVGRKGTKPVRIGTNTDSHYLVAQTFMLSAIRRSTWLAMDDGPDVLWTFLVNRGERADEMPILGMKVVGKAASLTATLPKEFQYTFRIASLPQGDLPPVHRLYLQETHEGQAISFGNARYPLDARTPLPAYIEPASVSQAITLIERGQEEAEAALREELNL